MCACSACDSAWAASGRPARCTQPANDMGHDCLGNFMLFETDLEGRIIQINLYMYGARLPWQLHALRGQPGGQNDTDTCVYVLIIVLGRQVGALLVANTAGQITPPGAQLPWQLDALRGQPGGQNADTSAYELMIVLGQQVGTVHDVYKDSRPCGTRLPVQLGACQRPIQS